MMESFCSFCYNGNSKVDNVKNCLDSIKEVCAEGSFGTAGASKNELELLKGATTAVSC